MSETTFAESEATVKWYVKLRPVARQVRFPRSKKKRIRKKWAKDPRNYSGYDLVLGEWRLK